jgi:SAM-dependent methyltransferase
MTPELYGHLFGKIKLEIGCGDPQHRRPAEEGYIGVDMIDYGQPVLWDIENGLPFPDNSASHIYCSHVFEHIDDLIGLMNECWRVLAHGGELWAIVPHRDAEKAYVPSHIRYFDKWTWNFFQYEEYAEGYYSKVWTIIDLVVNARKDIHVKMTPKNKIKNT